jgi:hypothetical protein
VEKAVRRRSSARSMAHVCNVPSALIGRSQLRTFEMVFCSFYSWPVLDNCLLPS